MQKPTTRRNGHDLQRPILVAGGAGFIGSHLCERLLRQGRAVLCLDNFLTSDRDNIAHLEHYSGFRLWEADVAALAPEDCPAVAAVFNLACPASPQRYQQHARDTLFTCVRGMDALLRVARRDGVKIFHASTSEIYGHPQMHPQKESYWGYVNTMGPRSCYDEGKRCAETLCFIYREEYGVPVRVARIFNTYGPRMHMRDGRVVVNLIAQALRNQPLTVYGEGRQTRSFCYVDDLLDAILLMMSDGKDFSGPINLGNPNEVEILDLAQRIVSLTGSKSKVALRPLPIDDPPRRRPDISLAREVLGWQPRTDLDTGLQLTIDYFEKRLLREERRPAAPRERGAHNAPYMGVDA